MKKPWTDDEIAIMRAEYPHKTAQTVADMLGRTVRMVYNKANQLQLKKTEEFFASWEARRLDAQRGAGTRFVAGNQPWNKGMKGIAFGGKATRFKHGSQPHNTLPIGSYRLNKDGTLQQKVGDAKGSASNRWRGVHELIWIAAHGPVPKGHIVVFKPGCRTKELEEITIDRVECISFAENMRRNTVHRLPKEIQQLCQLRGALNRQINKRSGK